MKYPVLLPNIFDYPFTYKSNLNLKVGEYVKVSFGKSKITGVVWDNFEKNNNKSFKIKEIDKRLNIKPLKKETIKFLNWFSEYNLVPKGMSLKLHLLSGEAIENFDDKEYNFFLKRNGSKEFKLSKDQNKILNELKNKDNKFRVHLLQGTTGSGKTIVYFKHIFDILEKNKQALILLPEIGLTAEFERKFKEFFGFNPSVWHSGISLKRKKVIWSGLSSGKIKVVIGARSSLFLPFKNMGLIIVDEEHDQSFKQDEGVIYNARDMAISRAKFENIPINLVTAVPSIETYSNVKKSKYSGSRLLKRYKDASLPSYEIIDLNLNKLNKNSWISNKTIEKVKEHLIKKDQILFFINRRGFAPFALCKNCLNVYSCPHCSINLVFHKNEKKLLCHYCGFKSDLDRDCKKGNECDLVFSGSGVERVAEEVKLLFPDKKISIFSSDTMSKKSSVEKLNQIVSGEIDILVGTQLISKGFHFPKLNCIVVLDIDLTLNGHDLRVAEKNLQLYHQLSGRAGRAGKPATVYFQTFGKNQKIISQITDPDPFIFLDSELKLRENYNLPPFERFVSLILTSPKELKLEQESNNLKNYLVNNLDDRVLGPVNAPIYKVRGRYRNRLLIRSNKNRKIQRKLSQILNNYKLPKEIKLTVDVDPISFN
jgi:primosomal protein N' (replication factor Y)